MQEVDPMYRKLCFCGFREDLASKSQVRAVAVPSVLRQPHTPQAAWPASLCAAGWALAGVRPDLPATCALTLGQQPHTPSSATFQQAPLQPSRAPAGGA